MILTINTSKRINKRYADDVALRTNAVKDMEIQLIILNQESKKVGLKIHRGKLNL